MAQQPRLPLSSPLNDESITEGTSPKVGTSSRIAADNLTLAGLRETLYGKDSVKERQELGNIVSATGSSNQWMPKEVPGVKMMEHQSSGVDSLKEENRSAADFQLPTTPSSTLGIAASPPPRKYHPLSLNANMQIRRMSMHPSKPTHLVVATAKDQPSSVSPLPKFSRAEGNTAASNGLALSPSLSVAQDVESEHENDDDEGAAHSHLHVSAFNAASSRMTNNNASSKLRSNENSVLNTNNFSFRGGGGSSLSPPGGAAGGTLSSAAPPYFNGALGAGGSLISNEIHQALATLKSTGDLLLTEGKRNTSLAVKKTISPTKQSLSGTSPTTSPLTPLHPGTSSKSSMESAGELILSTTAVLTKMIEEQMVGLYKHVRNQHENEKKLYGWGPLSTIKWDAKKGEWKDGGDDENNSPTEDKSKTNSPKRSPRKSKTGDLLSTTQSQTTFQSTTTDALGTVSTVPKMTAANSLATFLYLQLEAAMHLTGATRGAIYLADQATKINGALLEETQQQTNIPPASTTTKSTYARRVAHISAPSVTITNQSFVSKASPSGTLAKIRGDDSSEVQSPYPHLTTFKPLTIPLRFPVDVPLAATSTIATCIHHNIGINISDSKYKVHSTMVTTAVEAETHNNRAQSNNNKSNAFENAFQQAAHQRELNVIDAIVLPFGDGTSNRTAVGCVVVADRKRQEKSLEVEQSVSSTDTGTQKSTSTGGFDLVDEQHVASLCTLIEAVVSRYGAQTLLAASTEQHHHDIVDSMLLAMRGESGLHKQSPRLSATTTGLTEGVALKMNNYGSETLSPNNPQHASEAEVGAAIRQLRLASHIPPPHLAPSPATSSPPRSKTHLSPRQPSQTQQGSRSKAINNKPLNQPQRTSQLKQSSGKLPQNGEADPTLMLEKLIQIHQNTKDETAANINYTKSRAGVLAPPPVPTNLLDNPPKAVRRTVVLRISGGESPNSALTPGAVSKTQPRGDETLVVAKDVLASLEHWRKRNLDAIRSRPLNKSSGGGEDEEVLSSPGEEIGSPFLTESKEDPMKQGESPTPYHATTSTITKRPDNGSALAQAERRQKEIEDANGDEILQRIETYVANQHLEATQQGGGAGGDPPQLHHRRGSIGTSGANKSAIATSYPVHVISKDALIGEVGELVSTMEVLWVRSLEKVTELKDELDAYDRRLLGKDETIQTLELEVRRLNKMFSQLRSDVQKVRKAVPAHLAERFAILESGQRTDGESATLAIEAPSP